MTFNFNSIIRSMYEESSTGECRGQFFVINGTGRPTEKFGDGFLYTGILFYEVLKVREKVPLFLEDHLERLSCSINERRISFTPSFPEIKENIRLLINLNPLLSEGNIRLILHFKGIQDEYPDFYMYYIPHRYPSAEEYASGIPLIIINAVRKNVHSKIIDLDFRKSVNQKVSSANAWDALLVDSRGFITEGSKSNFFLIDGNKILTPPEKDVLPGITRKYIFDLCYRNEIEIKEKKIALRNLENYTSCFISGTSPGILAVSNIGPLTFDPVHPLLKKLSYEYEMLVHKYILSKKELTSKRNK